MARLFTRLADIQYIASSAASVYSNPSATKTFIKSIILFNGNTTTETVKLYNVPDSTGAVGTAGLGNQFAELQLATLETFMLDAPYPIMLIDENDSIQAVTTTASKVTIQLLGDKDG